MSTHILLGILLCPSGLPIVTELGCAVQHAWRSLPEVGEQFNLLPGLIPRDNCGGEGEREGGQGRRVEASPQLSPRKSLSLNLQSTVIEQSTIHVGQINSNSSAMKRCFKFPAFCSANFYISYPDLKTKALVTQGKAA